MRKVSLPEGWLDDPEDMTPLPIESELWCQVDKDFGFTVYSDFAY